MFAAGHLVTVSRRSAPGVDLEQLEDQDEVWSLCFRRPRPGWRLLGRFLERDVFVGLRLYERHFLRNRETTRDLLRKFPSFGRIASERPSHSGPLIWLPT